MTTSKKKELRLMVKNSDLPFKDWVAVWATEDEVPEYLKKGYRYLNEKS